MAASWSGQVAGMLHEIKPVRQIFEELYSGSKAVLEATSKEWLCLSRPAGTFCHF